MARVCSLIASAILTTVFVCVGNAQQAPGANSASDSPQEQKKPDNKPKKPAQKKVYTNSDVVGAKTGVPTAAPDARPEARASSGNADQPGADRSSGVDRSTIFDRPKQDSSDTVIVPAGTKITVDISEENPPRNLPLHIHVGKVVNIVQVGSTVVIPALSKTTIQDSVGVMELTDVTIDGVHYDITTDRVPLLEGYISEATFTLARPFTIQR